MLSGILTKFGPMGQAPPPPASRDSTEIGAGPRPPGLCLDQAQPLLDALDPAIYIVEAQLGRRVVDLHCRQVAFNRGHSGRQLTKPGLDTVQPLMDAREIRAEKIENV
jgi:hypothetical protein